MSLDFSGLEQLLRGRGTGVLEDWFPAGERMGGEFAVGSLQGEKGQSLRINIADGAWCDFATDDRGADLISLYAAMKGVGQGDAAKDLAQQYNYELNPEKNESRPASQTKSEKVKPSTTGNILPPRDAPEPDFVHEKLGPPVATWTYRDAKGLRMFYIARYDLGQGKKSFLPWVWDPNLQWIQKGFPAPRPLYGLELLSGNDKPVMIVEGEKTADAAREIITNAYVIVTWPNGSNAWDKVDWGPLFGRKILLWPDLDKKPVRTERQALTHGLNLGDLLPPKAQPGMKCMLNIARSLSNHCPEVKILNIHKTNLPDAFDAADFNGDFQKWIKWAKPIVELFKSGAKDPEVVKDLPATTSAKTSAKLVVVDEETAMSLLEGAPPTSLWQLYEKHGVGMNQNGNPHNNMENLLRLLDGINDFKDLVWFDEFHQKYFTRWKCKNQREWKDIDTINLLSIFQGQLGFHRANETAAQQAWMSIAHKNVRNEPKEWMESLEWDGFPRMKDFFINSMGVKRTVYSETVGWNFWLSLVARVLMPGCKVDNMVILEGKQAKFKSTALDVIGGKWFTEASESATSKDFFLQLQGKIIVEIAELDSFSKAEVNTIKKVVSCRQDRFRPPYGRATMDFPRQCIFVGTTNEETYLRDHTGGRRFWPLKTDKISIPYIKEHREQLFAEAVAGIQAGALWYLMPEQETLDEQEARREQDVWEEALASYLIGKQSVSIKEIGLDALHIELDRFDTLSQRRVVRALRSVGWVSKTMKYNDRPVRRWVNPKYVTPVEASE